MRSIRQRALACAVLVLATAAAYARVASNGFVTYDDPGYVYQNEVVARGLSLDGVAWAFRTTAQSNWHPLTWLSHMLDVQLFGLAPGAHHLMSVALHAASAVLLFLLLLRITARPWRSLAVAALFALHPLHVESVAWAAERKDVLSGLLFHLTLLAYVAHVRRPGPGRYAATLLSFAAGLLAKPMLVTLPIVMLLLDFWPLERWRPERAGEPPAPPRRRWARLLVEKVPFLALSLASSGATIYAQHQGGSIAGLASASLGLRLANALGALGGYVEKALWPHDLAVLYPLRTTVDVGRVIAGLIVLLAIAAAAVGVRRTRPYLAVGGLWFLVTLVPVIGLVQVGAQSMADRYTYLPLTGLFIAAVWGAADLLGGARRGRLALGAAAGAVLAAAAALTWMQLGHWKDSFALYRHALAVTGDNPLMVNNYGAALDEAGQPEEAIGVLEAGLAAGAASGSPLQFMLLDTYASALNATGRPAEAMAALERAVAARPTYAKSYYDLGRLLHVTYGDVEAASALYERAIALQPDYLDAYINLGGALNRAGRFDRGLEVLQRARALALSDRAELRFNLGVSYAALGDTSAALREAAALRRLDPGMAQRLLDYVGQQAAPSQR